MSDPSVTLPFLRMNISLVRAFESHANASKTAFCSFPEAKFAIALSNFNETKATSVRAPEIFDSSLRIHCEVKSLLSMGWHKG